MTAILNYTRITPQDSEKWPFIRVTTRSPLAGPEGPLAQSSEVFHWRHILKFPNFTVVSAQCALAAQHRPAVILAAGADFQCLNGRNLDTTSTAKCAT